MKNKRNVYILLGAVLLVWGIVAYKFFIYLKADNETSKVYPTREPISPASQAISETEELLLNYSDPFLKRNEKTAQKRIFSSHRKEAKTSAQLHSGEVLKNEEEDVDWKMLKYSGMIKNNSSMEKVALILYKSKNVMVKEGGVIGDFTLISIFEDSIHVRKGSLFRSIGKI